MKQIKDFIQKSILESNSKILSYTSIIKKIKNDYYEDFEMSNEDIKNIQKMLEKYKDKTFEYVDNLNMYSNDNSIGCKLIPDNWDPNKDKNTIEYLEIADSDGESMVSINKYKNNLYFILAIDPNDSIIYLIK